MVLLLESIFIYLTEDKRSSIKDVALTPAGVDFTNIFRAAFLPIFFRQKTSQTVSAEKMCLILLYQKLLIKCL